MTFWSLIENQLTPVNTKHILISTAIVLAQSPALGVRDWAYVIACVEELFLFLLHSCRSPGPQNLPLHLQVPLKPLTKSYKFGAYEH